VISMEGKDGMDIVVTNMDVVVMNMDLKKVEYVMNMDLKKVEVMLERHMKVIKERKSSKKPNKVAPKKRKK
jgi:hypothetical protein